MDQGLKKGGEYKMAMRRPDGEFAGIELFGKENALEVLERGRERARRISDLGEVALLSVAMMGSPRLRSAGLRLGMMAVDQTGDILPANLRQRRSSN